MSKCKTIRNPLIRSFLNEKQVPVFLSSSIVGSPFAAGVFSSAVYVPYNLFKNLSREEYEAVLAHEMEHIRHKDNGIRFLLGLIRSFFWWIPTKWLQKLIEEGQEIGCDRACTKYGINQVDLASAICKAAKNSLILPNQLCAHYLAKHIINKRVNLLLTYSSTRFNKIRVASCCVAATLIFHIVFLGRFWIF